MIIYCQVAEDSRSFQQIARFIDSNGHFTVLRRSEPSSRTTLMGEQPNPWELLHPQDVMSRHRYRFFSLFYENTFVTKSLDYTFTPLSGG